MEIKIQNQRIADTINFLYGISLKGKQSRHRTKFINELNETLKELGKEEEAIRKEHCHLDEEGNPKKIENGTKWDIKDLDAYSKDIKEFFEEERTFTGGNVTGVLKTIKEILFNYEGELSGADASLYDYLCDQFEEAEVE